MARPLNPAAETELSWAPNIAPHTPADSRRDRGQHVDPVPHGLAGDSLRPTTAAQRTGRQLRFLDGGRAAWRVRGPCPALGDKALPPLASLNCLQSKSFKKKNF
ncbi:hypothetical protein SKAU_G00243140 [Synaphobranchus kaupii]|uniref:Uncharacterized protein n=1 Tax=Synaphobranchus kaupii TaxID=118154 RepID=A0A9Q1ISF2_SYNKA|nr:hypothetical protein SKAU_G00243140 [Synaphobranchus kaupii]